MSIKKRLNEINEEIDKKVDKNINQSKNAAERYMGDDITMRGLLVTSSLVKKRNLKKHDGSIKKDSFKEDSKQDENISISEEKIQKEFLKDDKTIIENMTKEQQRGGNPYDSIAMELEQDEMPQRRRLFKEPDKNDLFLNKNNKDELTNTIEQEINQENAKRITSNMINKMNQVIENRKAQHLENIKHDMTHNAIGAMSGIQGANLDYDELSKMAKQNIRDYSELVSESLANDGFEEDITRVENAMKGFINHGKPDINELAEFEKEVGAEGIAQAYINVAKDSSLNHKDILKLTAIDERFDFERPCYENVFDRIRNVDKMADKILDRLDMEMGRER